MTIFISIFGRGRALVINDEDCTSSRHVYFSWSKIRKGGAVERISLESDIYTGDLLFRRVRDGREQGWRFRGPVEHFEA